MSTIKLCMFSFSTVNFDKPFKSHACLNQDSSKEHKAAFMTMPGFKFYRVNLPKLDMFPTREQVKADLKALSKIYIGTRDDGKNILFEGVADEYQNFDKLYNDLTNPGDFVVVVITSSNEEPEHSQYRFAMLDTDDIDYGALSNMPLFMVNNLLNDAPLIPEMNALHARMEQIIAQRSSHVWQSRYSFYMTATQPGAHIYPWNKVPVLPQAAALSGPTNYTHGVSTASVGNNGAGGMYPGQLGETTNAYADLSQKSAVGF